MRVVKRTRTTTGSSNQKDVHGCTQQKKTLVPVSTGAMHTNRGGGDTRYVRDGYLQHRTVGRARVYAVVVLLLDAARLSQGFDKKNKGIKDGGGGGLTPISRLVRESSHF